jgi:hypothetical protein
VHQVGYLPGRIERVTYKDWFDAECEQATIGKNKAYKMIQQRNHTQKAMEEYSCQKRQKKEYIHKRRRYLLNVDLRNWNVSEATTKANPSIEN